MLRYISVRVSKGICISTIDGSKYSNTIAFYCGNICVGIR